jgi:5-methyltetrahydrofolate--homocysteine methyltransferase
MSFSRIRHRLQSGSPLILDADSGASFRARGVSLDLPGTLGLLLREQAAEVLAHHRAEVASQVDVLSALTADTTPRALAEVGMQHRSAQLTGRALDLAFEAASEAEKPIAVASVLGSDMVGPVTADRLGEELAEHAARLRVSGTELVIARGQGSELALMAAIVAARQNDLPTWAVLESEPGSDVEDVNATALLEPLHAAGATVVLFEVSSVDVGLRKLDHSRDAMAALGLVPGVLLAASDEAVRGFVDPTIEPERWAERAVDLCSAGARVLGGGAGTTEAHTRALALALGWLHPSGATTRLDTEHERGPGGW